MELTRHEVSILNNSGILKHVNVDILKFFPDLFVSRSYQSGEAIILQEQSSNNMFVLIEGKVHIEVESKEEFPIKLTDMSEPGDIFGELAFLQNAKRSSTVRAVTKVKVIEINTKILAQEEHPSLATIIHNISLIAISKINKTNQIYVNFLKKHIELIQQRNLFGNIFIIVVLGFSITSFVLLIATYINLKPGFALGWIQVISLLILPLIFIKKLHIPLKEVGLGWPVNFNAMIKRTAIITFCGFFLYISYLCLLKYWTNKPIIYFINLNFLNPFRQVSYFLLSFLQELLARGLLQTSIRIYYNDQRGYQSILIAGLIFSSFHVQWGLMMVILTFLASLFFGYIFMKDKHLLGVSFLHYLFGAMVLTLYYNE